MESNELYVDYSVAKRFLSDTNDWVFRELDYRSLEYNLGSVFQEAINMPRSQARMMGESGHEMLPLIVKLIMVGEDGDSIWLNNELANSGIDKKPKISILGGHVEYDMSAVDAREHMDHTHILRLNLYRELCEELGINYVPKDIEHVSLRGVLNDVFNTMGIEVTQKGRVGDTVGYNQYYCMTNRESIAVYYVVKGIRVPQELIASGKFVKLSRYDVSYIDTLIKKHGVDTAKMMYGGIVAPSDIRFPINGNCDYIIPSIFKTPGLVS